MKIKVYDIETIKGCFLACYYDPLTQEWKDFEVSSRRNDLPAFLKFLELHKDHFFVGFNNINFDSQVIEYIWRNHERLLLLDSFEFCQDIWQFAQDVIETSNHGGFAPYREEYLSFKQLDVFRIQHFDNKNRMVG